VKDAVHHSVRKGAFLNLPHHKKPLKIKHVEFKSRPKFICTPGSIFKANTCVKCPVGTYGNMTTGLCELCPIGHYQPLEGSVSCLPCPPGTSTRRTHAKNVWECRCKCKPVHCYFSRNLYMRFFTQLMQSRLAMGPTQPPIQWVPGALSLGVKWPGREADHSHPSSDKVKE
jgi:hypothetical protein